MAPVAPKKRASMRAKLARVQAASTVAAPRKVHRPDSVVTDSFIDSKQDRRTIKRSAFLNQIKTKSSTGAGVKKRRRPSNKLVANLDSLADALPELEEGEGLHNGMEQQNKVRIKSLKSKPGALKRKEKLMRAEMKNFGLSLAYLASLEDGGIVRPAEGTVRQQGSRVDADGKDSSGKIQAQKSSAPVSTSTRWAALRAHISGTMEQNPAFLEKK